MGEYANVKRKNISRLLKWLVKKNSSIDVSAGGKHNILVKYSLWIRPFPIPFKNSHVNKFIVKDLMKKFIESKICTKEEFDEKIK
ncbi:hypothetical protein KAI92_03440 [Candidatus Parcubacteria bacterium]|nr:hypothetical protein [Candidatus Parcubacteria bacterium]